MSKAAIRQPGEGELLNVVGERIRILIDSAVTDGQCTFFEETTDPGKGPPMHRHRREDEVFYVLEGTVKFVVEGETSIVTAGGCAVVPKGTVHTFVNAGDVPNRMLIACYPAGLEIFFRELHDLGREGKDTPQALTATFRKYGLEIMGPGIEG